MIFLFCPAVMFVALLLFNGILWHIQEKAIDKEIKQKYPNWKNE